LFSRLVVVLGAVAGLAAGCNSADYSNPGPCTGPSCTCEQDPTLPRCKGFNDKPETGADLPDGAFQFDAPVDTATPEVEAGPDDAGDEAG
jgi:hypothetical protein